MLDTLATQFYVKSNHTCTGRWTHPSVCLVWDKIVVIRFFLVRLTMRLVASVLASEKPSSSVFFNRTLPQPTPYWTIVTYVTIIASSQSPRVTSSSPHCVDTICGDTFVKMIKTFVIVKWSLRKRRAIVGFLALACYDAICELVFVGTGTSLLNCTLGFETFLDWPKIWWNPKLSLLYYLVDWWLHKRTLATGWLPQSQAGTLSSVFIATGSGFNDLLRKQGWANSLVVLPQMTLNMTNCQNKR